MSKKIKRIPFKTQKNNPQLEMFQTKKSGAPTQPEHRTTAPEVKRQRKPDNIIAQIIELFKRADWKKRLLLPFVLIAGLIAAIIQKIAQMFKRTDAIGRVALLLVPVLAVVLVLTFWHSDEVFTEESGMPVNWEAVTDAWAAEAGFEKRYKLTDVERFLIASVVTAEAEGEPYAGKVAVAQCILQMCEDDDLVPYDAIQKYDFSKNRPDPCEDALEAVQAVFDFGHVASKEPIKYFYAPARVKSDWHESQDYVLTINGHKFFKEAKK